MRARTVKSIRKGERFQVEGSNLVHVAQSDAMLCGRGYVRIDTITVVGETGSSCSVANVVNIHGSNKVTVSQ